MTLIYGIAIAVGGVGILAAVGLALNEDRPDLPDRLRQALLAVFGFGLAGMAATFAGWAAALAVGAAVAGAGLLVGLGERYASEHP